MRSWIRRLHIWTGLSSSVALVLFGVAGIHASCERAPGPRERPAVATHTVPFVAEAEQNDLERARAIAELLAIPMSKPPVEKSLKRDDAGRLSFSLANPNGTWAIVHEQDRDRLRVEVRRVDFAVFLNRMHMRVLRTRETPQDWRLVAWSLYVEFTIFALFWLTTSGIVLWLTSRPRHRGAWIAIATGAGGACVAFYLVM